ncbi:restriction endonuclease subunit S [Enterococcus faecium]|uniref:restriction endonuclease subunit S n=1 Tax=Enterococcus faecium TaxID=1352 RepID=UPI00076407FF|nr:restriction endonuclease subunit S [Enterococcus faecium]KXA12595.1 type I restriction modification DNA specificity domain protein [Enterococcus faecium]MDQ8511570.1 restriction endonuclease subunit S [Enterococcus faecium]
MSNNTQPEIRFPGFMEDWEQRKLGDFIDVKSGKDYKHLNSGSIPVYGTGGYMLSVDRALSDIDAIGIGRKGTIDKPYLLKAPFWTVDTLFYAVPKQNIDLQFSLSIFKKINWKKFDESTGVPSLSKTVINSVGASVPSYEEQKKIGSFFKQLDETIALHQRKLDLLKETKKGFLQKMFPKNGAKVPEIRFSGFTEDWEQRKLGEIVQITMGQSPNSENYTENPEDYILVQGNADMKNNRVVPRVWTTQITKQAEKGDLILSVRAPVGDIGKTDYDVVLGRGVAAIKGNDFIFQQLGKMKESGYWNRFSTGSTFESINSNDIREALITIPTGEEQQKIGAFFKQLDDTIALHQRKLDLLKETKKGFLQKMFV